MLGLLLFICRMFWRLGFAVTVCQITVGCNSLSRTGDQVQLLGSITTETIDPLGYLEKSGAGAALQEVVVIYLSGEIRGEADCRVFPKVDARACARGDLFTGRLQKLKAPIEISNVVVNEGSSEFPFLKTHSLIK